MKRTAGELGLAASNCICDPMDLAALGHMENCPARPKDPYAAFAADMGKAMTEQPRLVGKSPALGAPYNSERYRKD